ncbi:hypothetical protein CFP56_002716 [Quercus suber]|uniref:Uncharacterized protein n=1 Tax=Quercus suber TaxID=58331 RepID=A0AAW0IKP6_QUESU
MVGNGYSAKDQNHNLARNLNGLDLRLLHFHLRNSHSENTILHGSLNLIHLSILRKPKPPQELSAATLHSMPRVFLFFLLHFPLSAYLEHLSSSTSTFTSSLLSPGRSALNTWASGVSFQSTWALTKAEVSLQTEVQIEWEILNGSQISSKNGLICCFGGYQRSLE